MGWRSQPTQRPKGVGDTPGLPIASRGPDIVPLIGSRRRDQLEEAPQPSSGIWSRSAGVTNWPLHPMSAAASLDFLPGGECRDVVKKRPSCNLWRSVLAPTSDNAMCLTYRLGCDDRGHRGSFDRRRPRRIRSFPLALLDLPLDAAAAEAWRIALGRSISVNTRFH